MITEDCFSMAWIEDLRRRYPLASPQILEKTMYAFELLGVLAKSAMPFVFKGGTALTLLLPDIKRLSIDVDLVGHVPLEALANAIHGSRFTRIEEDVRKGNLPAAHVKFFYQSMYFRETNYVLVDMLKGDHAYSHLQQVPLRRDELFLVNESLDVTAPAVNDILADKITAFAPNTTGILYGSNKPLEIIKQLFDVGELVTHASSRDDILATFERVRDQQNKYRGTAYTSDDILNDVIDTSYILCKIDLKGYKETEQSSELRAGMKAIQPYLLANKFSLPEAKLAASRAAFIATALKRGFTETTLDQVRFTPEKIEQVRNEQLTGNLLAFNKLRNTNPEAFYYWWLVQDIETM